MSQGSFFDDVQDSLFELGPPPQRVRPVRPTVPAVAFDDTEDVHALWVSRLLEVADVLGEPKDLLDSSSSSCA